MLKKKNYLLLALIFTVNSVNAGVVDKNERLKALLEKAKARESGAPVETTSTSPSPAATPINPKPISSSPVNNPIPDFKPIPTTSPSATKTSEAPATKANPPVVPKPTTAPVRERTPLQSRAEKSETIAPSPEPVRAPRILSTHPQQEAKPAEKPVEKAPEPSPAPSSNQAPKIEIKQETKVIQPPVSTLINSQPMPIRTQTNSNSQIKQKAKEENNLINDKTNTATPKNSLTNSPLPNPSANSSTNKNTDVASNYDDVLKSIDAIMKGTKVEEMKAPPAPTPTTTPKPNQEANPTPQFSNQTKTPTVSPAATPAPTPSKAPENKITAPVPSPVAATNSTGDKATSSTDATAATSTATGKEADYLLVLNKSLKSLEQDSWINVKTNMQEAVSYFEKEKKFNPKNPKLATYAKIILGFQRFGEAGMELDQGDLADFEEAEALYLDCQDNLEEATKELANDPSNQEVKNIINKVLQYTEEELNYIEEMLGM